VRLTVQRAGTCAAAATVLTVDLTAEGTPATAPSAYGVGTGADGVQRTAALYLTAAGRWTSDRLALPPGSYRMVGVFARHGRSVSVPVTMRVPT
jgi:hypothetical protein